ncbi:MAG: recombinase [Rubrivivax sp.]|nr:recombinase [Rubrivivax sp.]
MNTWDLTALLHAADAAAPLPERNLWLVRLLEWLRHGPLTLSAREDATPAPVLRLRQLCQVLERHEEHRQRVQALLASIRRDTDAVALLADFGFAPRASFASELARRLRLKLLPATPETHNLAELFALVFQPGDAAWLERLDAPTLQRCAALWPAGPGPGSQTLLDAITMLCSAVRAAGFSAPLRLRMRADALQHEPFRQLARSADALRAAHECGDALLAAQQAAYLRALLAECRAAADSVLDHLEEYGVSLHIVFDVDQLKLRTERIELLLEPLLQPAPAAQHAQALLLACLHSLQGSRSVRALLHDQSRQLARQVAERHAETGAHYITRTAAEYHQMLRAACGGGAVIALTTLVKFGLGTLGFTAFWGGFWAGVNYAASFVIVMLMHWTVATKQPAMTAPALAAKLPQVRRASADEGAAVEAFVDEVTHLIRSQMAGIIGNLALCVPLVLAVQLLSGALLGAPLIGERPAQYVLQAQTLLGPTALYAAFTGVLLFASSLIAGWVENAFVFHRLHSALRWNPALLSRLGAARAQRWADWWRTHISGLAANVSLGLMLGLVPVLLQFFSIPLDVRHVTLSAGQLAAALGALGLPVLLEPAFWWCAAAIPVIGLLNLSVSFALAFRVALRSRSIQVAQRAAIYGAIGRRLRSAPLSFLRPPRAAAFPDAGA